MSWIKGTTYETSIDACHGYMIGVTEEIERLKAENERLQKGLEKIAKGEAGHFAIGFAQKILKGDKDDT